MVSHQEDHQLFKRKSVSILLARLQSLRNEDVHPASLICLDLELAVQTVSLQHEDDAESEFKMLPHEISIALDSAFLFRIF